jgi:hypothetical protein
MPWLEEPFPGWVETVDSWPWIPDGPDPICWVKTNPCPRCHHTMTVRKCGGGGPAGMTEDPWTSASCDCELTECHKERRPKENLGCGQAGWIKKPTESS